MKVILPLRTTHALSHSVMPLRSLDLSWGSLLAAMHRVHVTGDVHRKKESSFALRTFEVLPHPRLAPPPGATSKGGGLNLIESL